ncbi:endocuticle structural glycoprotein SgAbd-2-like isoform X3 [Aphis gossypii]|uniref:endocuticle structural glycoprotein SgAbd-2-like isoform X3 n=1 Tax=Aphis gossypii TaxID=80765 RepID=UPI00100F63C4|nr:endocuticle structural glycoprotein SgAbd-2-like isoform X3 [Aphis gossypii]
MKFLVVLVAVIAAVAAATPKEAVKVVPYSGFPVNQGYFPGQQAYYPGYQGYNRGYYPGAPAAVYPTVSAVTPAPIIAPVPVAPKVVAPVYKPVDNKLPAIVRQSQEVNTDNFKYGYETENGIVAQAAGYVKNAGTDNAVQVIEGSYAYVGDDGAPVEVKYYADETGYHAVGNVVPTIPSEIAKSLELIASQPQKPEDSKKK